MKRPATAAQHDALLHHLGSRRRDWSRIGAVALEAKRTESWRPLGYHSFTQWLRDACPNSVSTAFAAMAVLTAYPEAATIRGLTLEKAAILAKLAPELRPVYAAAATTISTEALRQRVRAEVPGAAVKARYYLRVAMDAEQFSRVKRAIRIAKRDFDLETDAEALDAIASGLAT